jgi:hypothetical protein
MIKPQHKQIERKKERKKDSLFSQQQRCMFNVHNNSCGTIDIHTEHLRQV